MAEPLTPDEEAEVRKYCEPTGIASRLFATLDRERAWVEILKRQFDMHGYVPQDVAIECREMLEAAGMGKPGKANTLWAEVKEVCAEVERLSAEAAAIRTAITIAESPVGDDSDLVDLVGVFIDHHKEKETELAAANDLVARGIELHKTDLATHSRLRALLGECRNYINAWGVGPDEGIIKARIDAELKGESDAKFSANDAAQTVYEAINKAIRSLTQEQAIQVLETVIDQCTAQIDAIEEEAADA